LPTSEAIRYERKSTILLISGATIAVIISAAAVSTHMRLSATEGQEHGNETAEEIASEILAGQRARSEQNEKNNDTNNPINTIPAESRSKVKKRRKKELQRENKSLLRSENN
jgi:hypothetical protein